MASWCALAVLLALSMIGAVDAQQQKTSKICPLLGPQYPKPTDIGSHPTFQSAMRSVEDYLETRLDSSPYNSTAFSISIFDASSPDLAWQYHFTPGALRNSTQGTRTVDASSIYRIGSISKLLTVFVFLIEEGFSRFSDPVSKYLPELVELQSNVSYAMPNWEEITLAELAGQIAGLGRDYGLVDFAVNDSSILSHFNAAVLPALPQDEAPVCNYLTRDNTFIECSDQQYLEGVASSGAILPSASDAVYSNQAYAILGLVLSRIANKPMEQLFTEQLVQNLGLQGTSYTVPNTTERGVVGIDPTVAGWDNIFGVFTPAGGNFASSNDMAAVGRAILQSSLLPPALTRRWLKHVSFVNDPNQGVGLPWEIVRLDGVLNRTVDIYSKSGDWGVYSTLFALVPDHDIGVTLLTAFDPSNDAVVRAEISNLIFPPLVEAVEAVAKAQALANFAGTYVSSASNSSLTLDIDAGSALRLTAWSHEGKDVFNGVVAQLVEDPDWRLLPNNLYDADRGIGFTSFIEKPLLEKPFFGACLNWASVDGFNFGNVPLGQFVFSVDERGQALTVESLGLRSTLERVR